MTRLFCPPAVALFLLTASFPAFSQESIVKPAPQFKVTDISRFDDEGVGTIAINNQGEVVFPLKTQLLYHWDGRHHVFLWQGGLRQDIGILSDDIEDAGFPVAVSKQGQVLSITDYSDNSYLWNHGQLRKLGKFKAHALNEHGQVVGDVGSDSSNTRAVVWENGTIHVLPGLPDRPQAEADGINDKNQIVGHAQAPYDRHEDTNAKKRPDLYCILAQKQGFYITLAHACLWQNGKVIELAIPPGMAQTSAVGINNKAQIIGSATVRNDVNSQLRAVLWDHGKITFLGSLGSPPTYANAINDSGQIVGMSFLKGSQSYGGVRAFLWQDGRIYNLNSLIPKVSGWILQDATGINRRGQIVGYGQWKSKSGSYKMHIFLLTPR